LPERSKPESGFTQVSLHATLAIHERYNVLYHQQMFICSFYEKTPQRSVSTLPLMLGPLRVAGAFLPLRVVGYFRQKPFRQHPEGTRLHLPAGRRDALHPE
jgi:hypothetical protein